MSPTRPSTVDAPSRPKTTLFCPDCGHESDVNGDWLVHADPVGETHTCPVCAAIVAVRTRRGSSPLA